MLNGEHIKDSPFTLTVVAGMAEKERERQRKLKRKKKGMKSKPKSAAVVIPKPVKKDPKLVPYENSVDQIITCQSSIRRFLAWKTFQALGEYLRPIT